MMQLRFDDLRTRISVGEENLVNSNEEAKQSKNKNRLFL